MLDFEPFLRPATMKDLRTMTHRRDSPPPQAHLPDGTLDDISPRLPAAVDIAWAFSFLPTVGATAMLEMTVFSSSPSSALKAAATSTMPPPPPTAYLDMTAFMHTSDQVLTASLTQSTRPSSRTCSSSCATTLS